MPSDVGHFVTRPRQGQTCHRVDLAVSSISKLSNNRRLRNTASNRRGTFCQSPDIETVMMAVIDDTTDLLGAYSVESVGRFSNYDVPAYRNSRLKYPTYF